MTKKKYFYGIIICAITAMISAFVLCILTLNTPRTMEQLTTEMFKVNDSTIDIDITTQQNKITTRLLGSMSAMASQNRASLYTQVLDTDTPENNNLNSSADFVLDNDTLYIKTSVFKALAKQIDFLDFDSMDGFQSEYTSLYLPAYQLPSLNDFIPEWIPTIEESFSTYSNDLRQCAAMPDVLKEDGAYVINLDSEQLSSLITQMLKAWTLNDAQHYINLKGAETNYIFHIKQSSIAFSNSLADFATNQMNRLPDNVLEGSQAFSEEITKLGNELSENILENQISMSYSIKKDDGAYIMLLSVQGQTGSITMKITKHLTNTTINIPENSSDLEASLNNSNQSDSANKRTDTAT